VAAAAAAETVEDVLQSLTALELSLLALGMGKLELALRALEVADAKEVEQLLLFIEGQQVEQIQQQQQQQQQIASQCSWGSAASEELCGYTTAEFSLTA
jgi:ATP phosphoribosyltransferase regulatory subunit HisZ